jgi:hypothetical protein
VRSASLEPSTHRVDLIATGRPKGRAIRPLVEFHLTALESIRNSPSKGRRDASRPQYGRGRPGACRSETGPRPRVLPIVTQCLTPGQCYVRVKCGIVGDLRAHNNSGRPDIAHPACFNTISQILSANVWFLVRSKRYQPWTKYPFSNGGLK